MASQIKFISYAHEDEAHAFDVVWHPTRSHAGAWDSLFRSGKGCANEFCYGRLGEV